jgi:deoxyribodipyrimidine photolyase-related protein
VPRRWLFGDQLGPHFLDQPDQPALLIESKAVFRRRAFHRQKAHLILSAIRHRARELGDGALHLRAETFRQALMSVGEPVEVCQPTTRGALRLARSLPGVTVLPARGFVTSRADFEAWADDGHSRLRMAEFYRYARARHGVLMVGGEPAGGQFTPDPEPPAPRALAVSPPELIEDAIDDEVRDDLNRWQREGVRFVGRDAPRSFPVTRSEALARLHHFVEHRLPLPAAPSLLSAPLNLGLLDPMEAIRLAERAYLAGHAPLAGVEAFCRQLLGWRDYVWHLYWYFPQPRPARRRAGGPLPTWLAELDADKVSARCLADALTGVRDLGWVDDTSRRLILGNYAVQRRWRTEDVTDWFQRTFVDGHAWAMTGNVANPVQDADLGLPFRPAVAQGATIDRAGDHCGNCVYLPRLRLGERACPFTAGYWAYLAEVGDELRGDPALRAATRRLRDSPDIARVVAQETARADTAP